LNTVQKKDQRIRIIVVDDHPMIREGIKAQLSQYEKFEIIGEAADGMEAIRKAKELMPDIMIMDISMPEMNGLEATKQIHCFTPTTKVIVLTMHDDKNYILEVLRSGAHGYLFKDCPPEELVNAIETVHAGEASLGTSVSKVLLNGRPEDPPSAPKPQITELSAREQEVLALIAEGYSNKEIAAQIFLSVRTVETHRENIMRKLGIHSAAGLTRYAISKGLVQLAKD
jgi:two-component system nitrate/nitrite response regulator NarL